MKYLCSWKAGMRDKYGVPVAIISLHDAEKRREALIEIGFPSDWVKNYWPATDMRGTEQAALEELQVYLLFKQVYKRSILPGEIGCLLSHMEAIKWFYEESTADFMLVFEDDVLPTIPDFVEKLSELACFFSGPEFKEKAFVCHLGPIPSQWKNSFSRKICSDLFNQSQITLYQHTDNARGLYRAHAYIVSREAAKRYSTYSSPADFLADDWLEIKKRLSLDLLFVSPRIFSQNSSFESTIDEQGKRQLNCKQGNHSFFQKIVQSIHERSLCRRFLGSILARLRMIMVIIVRNIPCKQY